MFSFLHHIHANIYHWEVEDRQMAGFVQQHDALAVSDGYAIKDDTDAAMAVFPAKA
jgi:hypothetical protein